MYCGYIVELTGLQKHSNADRLQLCTVFGNTVIVDMSYYEGQKVVFFPTDGQLGKEFAEENNLVRIKNEDGTNSGGYLDPEKRNIKAMKLRGEKSEGLVLPVESLSKWTNVNDLSIGDKITTLNGTVICQKYIPRSNSRNNSNKSNLKSKIQSRNKFPYFKEHVDTEQLMYNLDVFKPGDTCYVTLKMHGCFNFETFVNLWNENKSKRISKIKKGDTVIGFKDGKFVPSKVLEVYNNGKESDWVHLKISRKGMPGEPESNIKCTHDHLFWDCIKGEYTKAEDLVEGNKIGFVKKTPILSEDHKAILLGMYLGDSYLCVREKVAKLEFGYKEEHEEYLDYITSMLGELGHKDNRHYVSGYGTPMRKGMTKECLSIKKYFDSILDTTESENKLTEKIIDYFTPLSLAFLYMDDGSLLHSDLQKDRGNIAICDYNEHDSLIIQKCLKKLGINSTYYTDSRGHSRLRILTDSSKKMFDMIEKYVPSVLRYKLPEEYRGNECERIQLNYEEGYDFMESYVISKKYLINKRWTKYDLHTETENYVVGGVLVHNSSGRTANTLKIEQKKQNMLQRLLHKKPPVVKTWSAITGTRRVVLDNNITDGWYGTNEFREKYHKIFEDNLPKGMEVFYEIVGWVDGTDTTIMGRCANSKVKDKAFTKLYGKETVFSYGCEPKHSDMYVYRMTMTNEDGVVTEIPWEEVKLWCERLGVKHVPEFDKFLFTTKEDLLERVEKYYEGPDPIGKTHVREGVVVRIDNRSKFTAYKHKNFEFKCLEGIIKDTSDAPDMEEEQEELL